MIEFSSSFGKFYIPVKASLPEHTLEFPQDLDFGLCPVKETAKKVFVMKNTGKLHTYYEWDLREPFYISNTSGVLAPGSTCSVTIEFKPDVILINVASLCDACSCYLCVW